MDLIGAGLAAFGLGFIASAWFMWPRRYFSARTVYLTGWAGIVALLAGLILVAGCAQAARPIPPLHRPPSRYEDTGDTLARVQVWPRAEMF